VVTAALRFEPIFVYIALAVCGVLLVARLLLAWAVDSS
jgi:hypothetical protein